MRAIQSLALAAAITIAVVLIYMIGVGVGAVLLYVAKTYGTGWLVAAGATIVLVIVWAILYFTLPD